MSKNKYKAILSLEIDLDEYPVPADGRIKEQLTQEIRDALYELSAVTIKRIEVQGKDLDE